jgi:hypothetical protein
MHFIQFQSVSVIQMFVKILANLTSSERIRDFSNQWEYMQPVMCFEENIHSCAC